MRRTAALLVTSLCCVGGLPSAALAQTPKAVGGVTQTQLATEAATARAAEAAALRYQTAVTSRAPTFTDDSTASYAVGSTWMADDLYTLQVATAGSAGWVRTPNHLLPGDQIGLHLATVALSAAGTGYAVGNTITVTGGAVLTVATITGGGGTGPIGAVTLTNPAYHACSNTTSGGLAQLATNGGGSGATFTGTFLGPYLYGARLLTMCYKANKAIDVAGPLLAPATIGFASSGLIDYATLDSLFPTGRSAVVTVYDQGLVGASATNSAAYACTMSPLRTIRGLRSVVCDGDPNGPLDSGAPNQVTSENLASNVSVNNQASTLIFVGGVESLDHKTGLLNVGGNGNPDTGLVNKIASNLPNVALLNGSSSGAPCPGIPNDRDNVIFGVNSAAFSYCVMNGVIGTAPSNSNPTSGTNRGGFISYTYDGSGFAYMDFSAAIVVPWVMSPAEITAADASIQTTFGIQRQVHSILVVDGDSDSDAHGSPAQHGWARMMMEQLGRPDIQMVDAAFFGSTMGGAASNGAPGSRTTEFPLNVAPVLDAAYAQTAPNRWVVLGYMGNNDVNRGDSLATIEANFTSYVGMVHAHHGQIAIMAGVVTPGAIGNALVISNLQAWLLSGASGADLIVPVVPCPSGVTCTQSDGLHPSQANDFFQAQSVVRLLAPLLK